MNTKTIVKMGFGISESDLARLGIEVTKDDDGRLYFTATFLSSKVSPREAVAEFRALFNSLFEKPATIFYHSETQLEAFQADNKTEKTIKVTEMAIRPEDIA